MILLKYHCHLRLLYAVAYSNAEPVPFAKVYTYLSREAYVALLSNTPSLSKGCFRTLGLATTDSYM